MVYRPSVVRPSTISNIFSETTRPIKAKSYVGPPCVRETKFYLRNTGHMTEMAATPINGKNLQKSSSPAISTKPGMQHWELLPIIVCSNGAPRVTLIYFTARSNLVT